MKKARFSSLAGHFKLMVRISKSSLSAFLSRHPFSIVHIDANWDGYRKTLEDKICGVESQYEQSVSFGYVDCDEEQAYAADIGIINVPSIAYYRGIELVGVVVGIQQDVAGNIEKLIHRQPLDLTNKLSSG
jgi:thioredoxin-like negative regulator of GroEL